MSIFGDGRPLGPHDLSILTNVGLIVLQRDKPSPTSERETMSDKIESAHRTYSAAEMREAFLRGVRENDGLTSAVYRAYEDEAATLWPDNAPASEAPSEAADGIRATPQGLSYGGLIGKTVKGGFTAEVKKEPDGGA